MGDRFEFGSVNQQVRNHGINPGFVFVFIAIYKSAYDWLLLTYIPI